LDALVNERFNIVMLGVAELDYVPRVQALDGFDFEGLPALSKPAILFLSFLRAVIRRL
jgi:hypothetical protein